MQEAMWQNRYAQTLAKSIYGKITTTFTYSYERMNSARNRQEVSDNIITNNDLGIKSGFP